MNKEQPPRSGPFDSSTTLEAICRGSNERAACEKLNGVAEELGRRGWFFNGYASGR